MMMNPLKVEEPNEENETKEDDEVDATKNLSNLD